MTAKLGRILWLLLLVACGNGSDLRDDSGPLGTWSHYGGDRGGMRFSPATQITPQNVGALEVAWTYRSGDFSEGSENESRTSFNATPLLVDDTLVFCTPMNRVIAVDAETGEERWVYDPVQRQTKLPDPHTRVCRGVAGAEEPRGAAHAPVRRRPLASPRPAPL